MRTDRREVAEERVSVLRGLKNPSGFEAERNASAFLEERGGHLRKFH